VGTGRARRRQDARRPLVSGRSPSAPTDSSRGKGPLIALLCAAGLAVGGLGTWAVLPDEPDDSTSTTAGAATPTPSRATTAAPAPAATPTTRSSQASRPAATTALRPVSVTTTCQAAPGIDSAGNPISYGPELTTDGAAATAWRCPGSAVGQRLVYDFGREVTITSVGLVPGYAKVDPFDGTNRFHENRTVTGVSWQFDDASSLDQALPAPQPHLQSVELVEPVTTRRVVLVVATTGNDAATRDFTAISDVGFRGF
jgi:hypothetical protein